ncbi:Chitooligosaccharidolytic beta-N-acetylglucosaminidase-like [Halocaridina rubra]|uniref:Beta-hexosaminidase n=1 Tax=Halocaridina rubra TaxID=373956 RepID=A0AAN8WLE5_HALRR
MATLESASGGLYLLLITSLVFSSTSNANFEVPNPWGWTCINETCMKLENVGNHASLMTFSKCKLTCGRDGVLWPKPTGITHIGGETIHFPLEGLTLNGIVTPSQEVEDLAQKAYDIFRANLAKMIPLTENKNGNNHNHMSQIKNRTIAINIDISKSGTATYLTLETNEAYVLNIRPVDDLLTSVSVLASTFFGARHALETLLQLMEYDEEHAALEMVAFAAISDSPKYKYRGILLDTARNFYSVKSIERTLDAMAANKLNTFHWHITDTHSFPLYLENLPDMVYYGAYSPKEVYKTTDIYNLVDYGRVRGIRVMPEFSAPAHAGNGWQWAKNKGLGDIALCLNKSPWSSFCQEPPCGQLNVVNENTYRVLGQIYEEMAVIFGPLDLFHFGGEEINLSCWNTTENITNYMREKGLNRTDDSFIKLWSDFQSKAYGLLVTANKGKHIPGILWASNLTKESLLGMHIDPEHYIIQIGKSEIDSQLKHLLQKGFHIIFSNEDAWSLDCGFGSGYKNEDSSCGGYKGWQAVYNNNPTKITINRTSSFYGDLILGGEATLRSTQTDEQSLDAKLWPRGAALAERLWTNPLHNWEPAETRFIHHRQRMVKRGIQADRIQPQWCHQNEGLCYL